MTVKYRRFAEIPALDNITYRQIDYWLRNDVISLQGDNLPGSGVRRLWGQIDVDRLMALDTLMPQLNFHDGGMHTPTGAITALWDLLADRPWTPTIVLQRTETGEWITSDVRTNRVFLVVPIPAAPNNQ